ncbi:hypothetical protein SAMN05216474_0581 [Lishizhenia tianjinensis]|uniref:Outer membrane protein beta-barrel domain-containing protein n=1 Tax=Lishizhenia tianjinensis TaxID=477690 RepID=A0A1I6Y110_9FLAO|nr:hypothetical protein [Lishizhenia tianjinensis]SFT44022.1 hypothetical protein SAMN05216474_0581 [Lishizhenia tianjinensis]
MKRLIVGLFLLFSAGASAQDYYQYAGPGLVYSHYQQDLVYADQNIFAGTVNYSSIIYGLSYGGKYLINKRPNISYGLASYPFGGVSFLGVGGTIYGNLGINVPVYGEFVLGNPEASNFFIGVGMEYNFYKEFGLPIEQVFGPSAELGGQIDLPNRTIAVKVAYTYGLNDGKYFDENFRVESGKRGSFTATLLYPF